MTKPSINVTPLIDVLLVLLIIFMVITPLKPTTFKAKVPAEPKVNDTAEPHPLTLVVALESDSSLRLNKEGNVGSVNEPDALIAKLRQVFSERRHSGVPASAGWTDENSTDTERTVFIKAPRGRSYGDVAKIVDAVKQAGAHPIGLQIDDLQ